MEELKQPIPLTNEEFEALALGDVEDQKVLELMKTKGINFDSGIIEVEVNGEKRKINTIKDDFGTIVEE